MGDGRDTKKRFYDESLRENHSVQAENVQISQQDETKPSFHKIHRNTLKTRVIAGPTGLQSNYYGTGSMHNNGYVTTPIPASDFQYSWINNSLGYDHGVHSERQQFYGYAPRSGIISSSSGFDSAISFPSSSQLYGTEV
jgi:hypothetical protein